MDTSYLSTSLRPYIGQRVRIGCTINRARISHVGVLNAVEVEGDRVFVTQEDTNRWQISDRGLTCEVVEEQADDATV